MIDENYDDLDRKILEILSEDGRIKFTSIARQINKTEGTVRNRVRRLRSKGVIKGFKALVDPTNLGYLSEAIISIQLESNYDSILKIEEIPQLCEDSNVKLQTLFRVRNDKLSFMFEVHSRTREDIDNLLCRLEKITGILNLDVTFKEEKLIDNLT